MTLSGLSKRILVLMRFPLFQVNHGDEILISCRLWHYILYGFLEYYTLYYPEPLF